MVSSISEFEFILKALNKMYFVKLKSAAKVAFFKKEWKSVNTIQIKQHISKITKYNQCERSKSLHDEVKTNHPVRLSAWTGAKLFIRGLLGGKGGQLGRFYRLGKQKVENEMNVDKILNTIRRVKAISKAYLEGLESMNKLKYSH